LALPVRGLGMSHLFADFPREVNMRTRKVVHNMVELQRYIDGMNGRDNLTTTVYGFRSLKTKGNRCEYSTAIVPHFVVDLDKGRAEEVLPEATEDEWGVRCAMDTLRLSKHLRDEGIRHAVWYSGGGFHVWVMLSKVHILEHDELANLLFSGRVIINKWVKEMDLVTIDPVVSFRPDRHIRIPNSFNFKRKKWSIPVSISDLEDGWQRITQKAENQSGGMKVCGDRGMEIEIVSHDPNMTGLSGLFQKFDAAEIGVSAKNLNGIPILPCLHAACCTKGSNPPHKPRSYLMMFLMDYKRDFARPPTDSKVSNGEVIQWTHEVIAGLEWSDYSPKITQQMLVHGASKNYLTPSCARIYSEGLCLGKCPMFDGKGVE